MKKRKRVMNELDKRPANTRDAEEWVIVDRGVNQRRSVNVGGRNVELYSSGATTYDKTLGRELKDKYKDDPGIMVVEKPYVQIKSEHKSFFTVPELPWKKGEDDGRN